MTEERRMVDVFENAASIFRAIRGQDGDGRPFADLPKPKPKKAKGKKHGKKEKKRS